MGKVRDRERACMAYVMGDERGREFVYRLLGVLGLYESTLLRTEVCRHVPDEFLPTYKGARQEIAQAVRNEALECDQQGSLYQKMMSEAQNRKVTEGLEQARIEAEQNRRKKEQGDDSGDDSDGNPS